jgi:hypothetical protein
VLKAVRAHTETGLRATGATRSSERVACENMAELGCCADVVVLCDKSLFDNCLVFAMSTCSKIWRACSARVADHSGKSSPLSAIDILLSSVSQYALRLTYFLVAIKSEYCRISHERLHIGQYPGTYPIISSYEFHPLIYFRAFIMVHIKPFAVEQVSITPRSTKQSRELRLST